MDIKKTEEYLKSEFGIKSMNELEEAAQKASDIDIGLFVTPIFWKKQNADVVSEGRMEG